MISWRGFFGDSGRPTCRIKWWHERYLCDCHGSQWQTNVVINTLPVNPKGFVLSTGLLVPGHWEIRGA